ncbi:cytochrome P450 ClCP1 [Aspergillus pseudonomiae]|uniref:Cytochrome P450 ClCP1 n=1 Tax=Aspergillus pseudonomiae TaxID=1506151 RepID=A0A5N6IAW1_9EURO|nr:cytochrome P450 ClCP1 [Aspergillus pseudonomiae]KAB8263715.1 cytochrome P450 ClCP1 [Aspergillus pseudonomiae]KAE8408580.1 cytochrome P450 ClCP1 [Aspergillus pseudonomiae]
MALLVIAAILLILYITTLSIYNLFLHPLASYPGPALWRAFRFPFLLANIRGQLPHRIHDLHAQYGDIVRVAPEELSFVDPRAWRDIYTSDREFVRPHQYKDQPPGKTAPNLIACSEADHTRLRKNLAPGFSEKFAALQEPILQKYIDTLFVKLDARIASSGGDSATKSADVDLVEWINYLAFDVIGDLTWGSSFGCLEGLRYHPWMQTLSQFKAAIIVGSMKFYPLLYHLLMAITPADALKPVMEMWKVTDEKVAQRVATTTPSTTTRPDFVGTMIASGAMTQEEMEVNSMLIVAAGSESITTVITGVINYLLREGDQRTLRELVDLLHNIFPTEKDITATRLKSAPYLDAVLMEGMRLCPTIPDAMRRQVPRGGARVAGQFVPQGMIVSIPPLASYRTPHNFTSPSEFAPRRWLGEDERFHGDLSKQKEAFNPFSLGSHNCPGQNLAWMELRLILARLLWRYDLAGVDVPAWEKQGIWWFWDKKPLVVRVRRAR